MRLSKKNSPDDSKHITVQRMWVKVAESASPIPIHMRAITMRKGDSLTVDLTADEIIEVLGADDQREASLLVEDGSYDE